MSIFRELLRNLLHFLLFVDWACAVIIWVVAVRFSFVMAGEWPDSRGFLTLRRPLASEFSDRYSAASRQRNWLMLAFLPVVAIAAFLDWLDILFFRTAN